MTKILLRNGMVAELRKIRDNKQERIRLKRLFTRSTPESLYHRFLLSFNEIPEDLLEKMIQTDEKKAVSLVCEINKNIIWHWQLLEDPRRRGS